MPSVGLADEYEPVFFAPPGPALGEAARRGFGAVPSGSAREFASALWPHLWRAPRVAFLATGLSHSLAFAAANLVLRRPAAHLHVVHGGTDERLSYGRKKWAARSGALLVAVSGFVRERLLAHGCGAGSIEVVENFLPDAQVAAVARVVHTGCREALQSTFTLEPLQAAQEGSTVTLAPGFDPAAHRLLGRVAGAAPFTGKLLHRGWRNTGAVKLPHASDAAKPHTGIIAPAEIELR